MLTMSSNGRIFLYHQPVSMRKSFEGLSAAVEHLFPGELLSGAYFVFLNRQQDHMKVLYWDGDGLAIWYKRLEQGTFSRNKDSKLSISRQEFLMLLEGIVPKRLQLRYRHI